MAQQPIKKARKLYPGMVSIPSFVFPEDQARSKEMQQDPTAGSFRPKTTFNPAASSNPTARLLAKMPPRNPAELYSYGGRCYPSFEAAKAAHPEMPRINNPSNRRDPGERAARLSNAMGYSKTAPDMFGALAEAGGGAVGKRAFAPLGHVLDAVGAGSTLTSSLQRGEPADVAVIRAASPVVGGAIGEVGGGAIGAVGGGLIGVWAPVIGNAAGAVGGGIFGGIYGSREGGKLGEKAAEAYARARRYRE